MPPDVYLVRSANILSIDHSVTPPVFHDPLNVTLDYPPIINEGILPLQSLIFEASIVHDNLVLVGFSGIKIVFVSLALVHNCEGLKVKPMYKATFSMGILSRYYGPFMVRYSVNLIAPSVHCGFTETRGTILHDGRFHFFTTGTTVLGYFCLPL